MRIPKWILLPTLLLIILGTFVFVRDWYYDGGISLKDIADLALILTLAALLFYTYYTYLIAKETSRISASVMLKYDSAYPDQVLAIITNHCRVPLQCWCNINSTVYGNKVSLGGFYSGESSFDMQPFAVSQGHFTISKILEKANCSVKQMQEKYDRENPKDQLYMDIEFWYNPVGSKETTHNPRQPHYYDFARKLLIMDF